MALNRATQRVFLVKPKGSENVYICWVLSKRLSDVCSNNMRLSVAKTTSPYGRGLTVRNWPEGL